MCEKSRPHRDFFFLNCPILFVSCTVFNCPSCALSYCVLWIFPLWKIPRLRSGGIRSPDRPVRSQSLYRLSHSDANCRDFLLMILIYKGFIVRRLYKLFGVKGLWAFQVYEIGLYSEVGIVTRYGLEGPGIESRWGLDFQHPSRRPWGPPSLLYNGHRLSFTGVKQPWRCVDHPPSSSA
jgi:hypothetical protein